MNGIFDYVKNYLSLDERKSSLVMVVFAGFSGLGMWKFFKYGSSGLDANIIGLILGLAGLVLGVNYLTSKTSTNSPV